MKKGEALKAGDKVYTVGMKKIIALYHIGEDDLAEGMNILCAHIDSPRLDIKQNPLYEDTDLAYLDTHYYGGVKKYQWVALSYGNARRNREEGRNRCECNNR